MYRITMVIITKDAVLGSLVWFFWMI